MLELQLSAPWVRLSKIAKLTRRKFDKSLLDFSFNFFFDNKHSSVEGARLFKILIESLNIGSKSNMSIANARCYNITRLPLPMVMGWSREYSRGKYHSTVELLFDWFGISCMIAANFCLYLQNRLIPNQSNRRSTVQWYFPACIYKVKILAYRGHIWKVKLNKKYY